MTTETNPDPASNATKSSRPSSFGHRVVITGILLSTLPFVLPTNAAAQLVCARDITANVVALDQPVLFNRLGASNVNGMIFALERDVINRDSKRTLNNGGESRPGKVALRPDKRPRPLVLRIRAGDCLTINLRNLLSRNPNPFNGRRGDSDDQINVDVDEQVRERRVSIHVAGLQYVNGPDQDDGAFVGQNADSTIRISSGRQGAYTLYAAREGVFQLRGMAATLGSEGNQGNSANLLFGQVIVEPELASIYRSTVTDEELRLSLDIGNSNQDPSNPGYTVSGHPIIDYEALYPARRSSRSSRTVWDKEGKGGLPVLNMLCNSAAAAAGACVLNEIVHSAIDAVIAGPNPDGTFPPATYPLEATGRYRNPTLPNRLEAFRDFASMFHDEVTAAQAFPRFYDDAEFGYVLEGVADKFMINYGSGGIGSEILANRLRVGPMHDCLTCAFEEFFLSAYTVGEPAQLVDVAANTLIERVRPSHLAGIKSGRGSGAAFIPFLGPKATYVPYPDDPANVHHSYTGDFVKFRNTHVGKEQHVFHLHNHQWLYNPNDDNSNYIDAQGIGPGSAYTYEMNLGGSGNRNKTAGDAIFHCHFYPHFAQGMWYLWRIHDVLETGTPLAVSRSVDGFHRSRWGLENGTPMLARDAGLVPVHRRARVRALPDGEVVVGSPIVAVVPVPGKPMPELPEQVQVVPNPLMTAASEAHPDNAAGGLMVPVGSLARVTGGRDENPGYPFWVAGIEDIVGQRPPTPPLDMIGAAEVTALQAGGDPLWDDLVADQADGFSGGLPRAALQGYAAGGAAVSTESLVDFSKVLESAQGVFYPEEGTDLEQLAMAYHAVREHPTCLPDGTCDAELTGVPTDPQVDFVVNGNLPAIGAPYNEPCIDDNGVRLGNGVVGNFFSGGSATGAAPTSYTGSSRFNADNPRVYKGANIQFDAVFNKVGYHYSQQRIITLWEDSAPVINKTQAPEPLVLRFNTFECGVYHHANLIPEYYEMDDYQVRTPTDIMGQHIHLPKWDLTTADGSANGWNYEDGTLSPGSVRERIAALNDFAGSGSHRLGTGSGDLTLPGTLTAVAHPFWAAEASALGGAFEDLWTGARVTQQRWFFDPVTNINDEDRGLGIIFTHDHYGPSTHQQIGLYATVLTEPANSRWRHNESGQELGDSRPGVNQAGRIDGGPTSWQAAIIPPETSGLDPYREFYFEYADFQHAYEAGVYIGADQDGVPLGRPTPGVASPMFIDNTGNVEFSGRPRDAFRFAINPPFRQQIDKVPGSSASNPFPDLIVDATGISGKGCATRPCPQAIDVDDPGMFVVNYRNEPIGLRIYDPNRRDCPDGRAGCQAVSEDRDGDGNLDPGEDTNGNGTLDSDPNRGDLAWAFETRTDRAIAALNRQPTRGRSSAINGTFFPPPLNVADVGRGDPYTPMARTFTGDVVRVKMQAGGSEEEHQATIHGLKWLQGGSAYGKAGNSGWRNAQSGALAEQFTLTATPPFLEGNPERADLLYSMDTSQDGYWSGMWGLMRTYSRNTPELFRLPNTVVLPDIVNRNEFDGVCPINADVRTFDVTAMLAGDALPRNSDVAIVDRHRRGHLGVSPDWAGGTLVYNSRTDSVIDAEGRRSRGPIHDPTAMVYLHTGDLAPADPSDSRCFRSIGNGDNARLVFDPTAMSCPVKLARNAPIEPLVLRASAGECIKVTLRNRLPSNPEDMPELATYNTLLGVVKRDRLRREGATTFQPNLFLASNYVGLHPQLVAYDTQVADGTVVGRGNNSSRTLVPPTEKRTFSWYAGHVGIKKVGEKVRLIATPVEFGATNLQPADKIKQGMKSLVGQLIIEPQNATWAADVSIREGTDGRGFSNRVPIFARGGTRAQATVCPNGAAPCRDAVTGSFREFVSIWTKGQTHHYANSEPVEHVNGEDDGIPEDSQENTGMAMNYRIEPLWFRLGLAPNTEFGHAGTLGSFGDQPQFDVFSNAKIGGDPETPVYHANAGQPFRIRLTVPHGTNRGSTAQLHGYEWQRDPYVCPGVDDAGIVGRCSTSEFWPSRNVGSTAIGHNAQGFYYSAQSDVFPATHFELVLPNSNGQAPGDYLFRDAASFGSTSGLWGIVRVE